MTRLAALALALVPLPAMAAPASDLAAALAALQAEDARLQTIGWRLARANAAFCPEAPLGIGLLLLDTANFQRPDAVREALKLKGAIAVDAVAAGSPAAAAGLAAGEEVLAIGDTAMQALPAVRAGDYARLTSLHDRIDAELVRTGEVALTVRSQVGAIRTVTVAGEPACRSRFELATDGGRAMAEGSRVIVGRRPLAQNPDDAEAATIIAHELAHNILRHRARLNAAGRSARNIRDTEREADRLGPWLMANAGYDPAAAVRFVSRWLRARDGGLFRAPTHDGWRGRRELIEEELAAIAKARAASPSMTLDWRARFAVAPG